MLAATILKNKNDCNISKPLNRFWRKLAERRILDFWTTPVNPILHFQNPRRRWAILKIQDGGSVVLKNQKVKIFLKRFHQFSQILHCDAYGPTGSHQRIKSTILKIQNGGLNHTHTHGGLKMEKIAISQNCLTNFDDIGLSWLHQPLAWKIEKSGYVKNHLTNFNKIWINNASQLYEPC